MVVPPPIAAPCTAAIKGLSKSTRALISKACGDSPGPGGCSRKSCRSLPAQNEAPAPYQSTTRVRPSFPASSKIFARVTYMPDVMAFFFAGRFSSTRRMLPERSAIISSMVNFLCCACHFFSVSDLMLPNAGTIRRCDRLRHTLLGFRSRSARTQAVDFALAEAQLLQDFLVVLAESGSAPCRHFGNAVDLDRTADRRCQLAAGTFERNDDIVRAQLRIIDHLMRPAHGT